MDRRIIFRLIIQKEYRRWTEKEKAKLKISQDIFPVLQVRNDEFPEILKWRSST
jgi:hypothetical protein